MQEVCKQFCCCCWCLSIVLILECGSFKNTKKYPTWMSMQRFPSPLFAFRFEAFFFCSVNVGVHNWCYKSYFISDVAKNVNRTQNGSFIFKFFLPWTTTKQPTNKTVTLLSPPPYTSFSRSLPHCHYGRQSNVMNSIWEIRETIRLLEWGGWGEDNTIQILYQFSESIYME